MSVLNPLPKCHSQKLQHVCFFFDFFKTAVTKSKNNYKSDFYMQGVFRNCPKSWKPRHSLSVLPLVRTIVDGENKAHHGIFTWLIKEDRKEPLKNGNKAPRRYCIMHFHNSLTLVFISFNNKRFLSSKHTLSWKQDDLAVFSTL